MTLNDCFNCLRLGAVNSWFRPPVDLGYSLPQWNSAETPTSKSQFVNRDPGRVAYLGPANFRIIANIFCTVFDRQLQMSSSQTC
jgi:hypothetical protein